MLSDQSREQKSFSFLSIFFVFFFSPFPKESGKGERDQALDGQTMMGSAITGTRREGKPGTWWTDDVVDKV